MTIQVVDFIPLTKKIEIENGLYYLTYNILFEENDHDIKDCLLIKADEIISSLDQKHVSEKNYNDYIEFKISEKLGYHYKNFSCLQDFKYMLYSYNKNEGFKCQAKEE